MRDLLHGTVYLIIFNPSLTLPVLNDSSKLFCCLHALIIEKCNVSRTIVQVDTKPYDDDDDDDEQQLSRLGLETTVFATVRSCYLLWFLWGMRKCCLLIKCNRTSLCGDAIALSVADCLPRRRPRTTWLLATAADADCVIMHRRRVCCCAGSGSIRSRTQIRCKKVLAILGL